MRAARLLVVLLAGCAAQTQYTEPERPPSERPTYSVGRERDQKPGAPILVDRPRSTLWRQVLSGADKAGLVIEGADTKTGAINVRYTGDPKDYIDCGRVVSKVSTAKGDRNYDFAAAKAYQQYELQKGDKLYLVDRRMHLDVNATLTLESPSPSQTRVSLDTRYTATRDQAVRGGGAKPFSVIDKVNFTSRSSATFPNAATKCFATGEFEKDLMDLVRR